MNSSDIKGFQIDYNMEKSFTTIFFVMALALYVILQIMFLNYKFYIEVNEVFKVLFNTFTLFSAILTYKFLRRISIIYIIAACVTITCIDLISLTRVIGEASVSNSFLNLIISINSSSDCITYIYILGFFVVLKNKKINTNMKIVYSICFIGISIIIMSIISIGRFNIALKYMPIITDIIATLIFIYTLCVKGKYIKENESLKEYIFFYLVIMLSNLFCMKVEIRNLSFIMEFIASILIYIMVSEKIFYKKIYEIISDVKQNFDNLRKERLSYKNVFEEFTDGIIIEKQNKVIFMNKVQRDMLGLTKNEIVKGNDINKFVHMEYFDNRTHEEKMTTIGGKELFLEVDKFNIVINGEKLILKVVRDTSEKKHIQEIKAQIDKMKENDKIKGEFFANISHELRTPINVIYSALQVMQIRIDKVNFGEKVSDKVSIDKYIKILKQNCYRLLRIISNLIDITKIDTGFLKPCVSNREIISLIENITMSIVPYLHQKGMELIFDTDVEEKYVQCDPDMIERVMLNLFSNAVKFRRDNGKVLVNIHDKGSKIILEVEDNGIGIPKEKQDLIFKRFKQVNPSFAGPCQGSGIGLSLVKSIVEMNKGKINVESEENVGTKFTVELPAIQNEIMKEYMNVKKVDDNNIKNIVEKVNIEFADIYID